MRTKNDDIHDILSRLLTLDPYMVVLFGSRATGTKKSGSDIDLLVVLDSEAVSQTYEERMKRRLMVRDSIQEINGRIPIDLIVYTKAEYEILETHGTSFLNEIRSSGRVLYEKAS